MEKATGRRGIPVEQIIQSRCTKKGVASTRRLLSLVRNFGTQEHIQSVFLLLPQLLFECNKGPGTAAGVTVHICAFHLGVPLLQWNGQRRTGVQYAQRAVCGGTPLRGNMTGRSQRPRYSQGKMYVRLEHMACVKTQCKSKNITLLPRVPFAGPLFYFTNFGCRVAAVNNAVRDDFEMK